MDAPPRPQKQSLKRERGFRYSSSSSSAEASRHMRIMSVPTLYQAFETKSSKTSTPLAFTSEELQLASNAPRATSAVINKKGRVQKSPRISFLQTGPPHINSTISAANKFHNKLLQPNLTSFQLRARPTVTTILRQHHVLERAEKIERDKVDSLMVLNMTHFEVDNLSREQSHRDEERMKTADAKKFLQAKLAYERAKAATQKVIADKQKLATDTRKEMKEWQAELEEARKVEKERKKVMTEQLQKTVGGSRRAVDLMVTSKQKLAAKLKEETEQLQAEARLKKQAEELKRQDRIQQIQASKVALKQSRSSMITSKPSDRSLATPETQAKLQLQKKEEEMRLEETRQKIQRAKQIKSVKLIRAMKKIQSETHSRKQSQESETNKVPASNSPGISKDLLNAINNSSDPNTTPSTIVKPISNNRANGRSLQRAGKNNSQGEIEKLLEELNKLKTENSRRRNIEQTRKSCFTTSGSGTIQIIQQPMMTRNVEVINPNPVVYYSKPSHVQNTSSIQNKYATLTVGRHY